MNRPIRTIAAATLLASLPLLGACESKAPAADPGKEQVKEESVISRATREAVAEARKDIAKGNITISGNHGQLGRAEITPAGDLLIDGRAVAITPEQRTLLLEYRGHVAGVAEAGVDIGMQGANLAAKAVGEALKLCDRLPAMMASQQKLKASLPAFAPYATMTQDEIDDCRKDAMEHKGPRHENFAAKAAAEPSIKR
jgi:hypothetical protein